MSLSTFAHGNTPRRRATLRIDVLAIVNRLDRMARRADSLAAFLDEVGRPDLALAAANLAHDAHEARSLVLGGS
jgi:hypothetical protein